MRLSDAFSFIIPVESHSRQKPEPAAPVPVPEAGASVGRASAFSFSAEGAPTGADADPGVDGDGKRSGPHYVLNLPEEDPPEFRRVYRAAADVSKQTVRVLSATSPDAYLEVDRLTALGFSFVEYRPKPHPHSLQPSVRNSYAFRFKLHPPDGES